MSKGSRLGRGGILPVKCAATHSVADYTRPSHHCIYACHTTTGLSECNMQQCHRLKLSTQAISKACGGKHKRGC